MRKIKVNANENLKDTKRNNDSNSSSISIDNNSNCNLSLYNSINDDLVIYNRYQNNNDNDINYINTNNELLHSIKTKNYDNNKNNEISETVNNKLKTLYVKLKEINEKEKTQHFKCRICFCEGSFEGKNPLISPCKCTGSVTYIHLNCLRKWLTSKVITKTSPSNNIYCYIFISLECEICKTIIPEIVEYRGKYISLLDFKDIEPPYIILQSMHQYNLQNRNVSNISDLNMIFVMSFKQKKYLVIGRANNSDIRLNDVSVSRNHSMISYDDGNFYIDDIGSKFGTLLLIQNNILFLPYKDISIQTGKCHLSFKLKRTCLGCFKCYQNKKYEKMSYEDYFKTKDKNVYNQIIDNYNNNIVDPLEKFSSINGSISISQNNDIDKENNDDDNEKTERNKSKSKIILDNNVINSIHINNINEFENDMKKLNDSGVENNKSYNGLIREHNESNDIIFHDVKSTYVNKGNGNKKIIKEKINFSTLNIMNVLKRKNLNKNPTYITYKINGNFCITPLNNINFNNYGYPNSQRENYTNINKFHKINNSCD